MATTDGAPPSNSGYDKLSGETDHDPDMSFEGLGLATIEDTVSETGVQPAVKPPVVPPVQTPQSVVTQPQTQQPQAPQAQQPPQPQATEPQQTQPPAQAPQATSQPETLDSVISAFEQNLPAIADNLAQNFAIDDVMAQELETDFRTSVPKLLSRVFAQAVQTNLMYMRQFIPQMIQQDRVMQAAYKDAEDAFFGKFKQLDRTKHGADIRSYGAAFYAQNPKLSRDELFNLVGAAVMAKHGIIAGAAPQQPVPPAPPRGPAQAFVPVGNSAPAAPPQLQPRDGNEFWGLGQDFDS